MFKYSMSESSQLYYRQLRKHGIIKVCIMQYLMVELELVLPTFKSLTMHTIIYNI